MSSLGAWTLDRADGNTQAPPDRVLHLDLATGLLEAWLSGVPYAADLGFDAGGHPFLLIEHESVRVLLLMGKADVRDVYSGSRAAGWPESPAYNRANLRSPSVALPARARAQPLGWRARCPAVSRWWVCAALWWLDPRQVAS